MRMVLMITIIYRGVLISLGYIIFLFLLFRRDNFGEGGGLSSIAFVGQTNCYDNRFTERARRSST